MVKLKTGDKFIPRKPKHPEHPLYNEFWGLVLTVKDIGIHWIKCYENNLVFFLDWCEKVEDPIPAVGETIDWEQRRYEIAKDFMAAQINSLYLKKKEWNYTDEARYAVNAADVLIKQLQK